MIKRILLLAVILLLVMPAEALANDGGAMMDDKEFLTIKYNLPTNKINIGEVFEFSVTLTNNTSYPIDVVEVNYVFSKTATPSWGSDEYADYDLDLLIQPGEKAVVDISVPVPEHIYWYKKNKKFYCDFDLGLVYFAYDEAEYGPPENEEEYDDLTWHYLNPKLKTVPLEILNLNDGTNLLDLSLNEKETTFYFPESQNHELNIYDGELESVLYNQLSIQNISESTITNIYIRKESKKYTEESLTKLNPGHKYSALVYSGYFLSPQDTPNVLPAEYKVIFKVDDLYYCNEIIKEYSTEVLYAPEINIDFRKKSSNKYIASITNTSGKILENLFFSFAKSRNTIDFTDNYIDVFNNNDTIEIEFNSNIEPKIYFIGVVREKKVYFWEVNYPSYEVHNTYYEDDFFIRLEPLIETPSPTPTLSASPTPKPTSTPSPTTSPSPTPSPTPFPSDTPVASPTSEPTLEVVAVKKSSSIPFWVWYVLAVAVIGAIALIITIRKKKDDDKLKYE